MKARTLFPLIPVSLGLALALAYLLAQQPPPSRAAPTACVAGPHSGTINFSQEWCAADNPHLVNGSVTVAGGVTLTIEPGVEVRFVSGVDLNINSGGTLLAEGMPTQTITFTTNIDPPVPGSWRYFIFHGDSRASLAFCDLAYAGQSNYPALYVDSSGVQLSNCSIHDNLVDAIQIRGTGLAPTLQDLTIANNGGTAVYQNTIDMTPHYSDLNVSGNGTDAIVSAGGSYSRDATLSVPGTTPQGVLPYIWYPSVGVNSGHTLAIDPGVELRFPSGFDLDVQSGATLLAEGTVAQPITFTTTAAHPPLSLTATWPTPGSPTSRRCTWIPPTSSSPTAISTTTWSTPSTSAGPASHPGCRISPSPIMVGLPSTRTRSI
jgi:hypothetical protein